MGKIIRRHTWVTHPETMRPTELIPGDEVPEWAEDLVTNPKVFEDPNPVEEEQTPVRQKKENLVTETVSAPDYSGMNISQLDRLLDERDLSKAGNKPEKIERLKAHDGAHS